MAAHNPRNRNEKTHEAPKSTARWFDDRRKDKRHPIGFIEHLEK